MSQTSQVRSYGSSAGRLQQGDCSVKLPERFDRGTLDAVNIHRRGSPVIKT